MLEVQTAKPYPPAVNPTYQEQFRRCTRPSCRACRQGKGHGPYWYAYWRQNGRVHSRYIGKKRPVATTYTAPGGLDRGTDGTGALRITSLGGLAVWQGDRRIPTAVWTRRRTATALLHFLLYAPGHYLPREQVIERIWHPESRAAGNARLDSTVHALNTLLGRPPVGAYVRSIGKQVLLAPLGQDLAPGDWLDACAFEQAARAACRGTDILRCQLARTLYTGAFLPEVVEKDSDPDQWDYTHSIIERRRSLQEIHTQLLLHLAGITDAATEAIACLHEILHGDPCDERAAGMLMRHYIKLEQLTFAKSIYRSLERSLRVQQSDEPCAEIRRLWLELERGTLPRHIPAS